MAAKTVLSEQQITQVIMALSDAGMCICETYLIGDPHPAMCDDLAWIIGRLEESGDLN